MFCSAEWRVNVLPVPQKADEKGMALGMSCAE